MNNKDLIERAASLIRHHHTSDGRLHGDVGALVVSESGIAYEGICVDTASWGLCAERSALAAMITAGEYRFQKVVAVWRHMESGALHVLPPCGICREFMRQIDNSNLEAEIVLGLEKSMTLRELIPQSGWPGPIG